MLHQEESNIQARIGTNVTTSYFPINIDTIKVILQSKLGAVVCEFLSVDL
jgi:hypothetical protein